MEAKEFIAKAYDNNAFTTAKTSAGYINPEIWNKEVLDHVKANLVVAPLGKSYNDLLDKPGDTLNITVGTEPAAAAAVAESDAVSITDFAKTQVVFSPTEYGAAYQLTNKEKSRSFINLMQDMTAQLGYQLALKKDSVCVSLLQSSAGNTVVANGVASTDIASSDTIDYDDIVNGKKEVMKDKLVPKYLIVGAEQYADLLKLSAFRDASQFNGDIAHNGFIGRISGMDVFWTTQISPSASKAKALILGVDGSGNSPFGIAQKKNPYLETEYHALERYTDIVAIEDYAVKLLRADGVCSIESYAA
ncbi:phage major capsid protein [Candidatus Pacearchaeota archaeon]|nr:phage major capsid protein [Candidatus Pacearchaeota archaeon]|tara:strand:- start:773 stop:1684 length:912 start_codon:yes stop_codon:yes gene_type:complete